MVGQATGTSRRNWSGDDRLHAVSLTCHFNAVRQIVVWLSIYRIGRAKIRRHHCRS